MKLQIPIVEMANESIVDVSEIIFITPLHEFEGYEFYFKIILKTNPQTWQFMKFETPNFSKEQAKKQRQHLAEKWSEYKQLMLKK